MYCLIDCNNFFVSCERVFDPSLRHVPVIVLSNNDGCIIARSEEAKKAGIPMAEPVFKVRDLIWRHNIVSRSSNYTLYGDMSRRVMEALKQFTDKVEIYSSDEAFLTLDERDENALLKKGKEIKACIQQWTGLPISIGVAPTKTLAKLANQRAKNNKIYQGVGCLISTDQQRQALTQTPLSDIWGIGFRLAKTLNKVGIYTALQLIDNIDAKGARGDRWIRKKMKGLS